MHDHKLKIRMNFLILFLFQFLAIAQAGSVNGASQTMPSNQITIKPGTVFTDCDNCPEMVVIPEGNFMMGSRASEIGRQNHESPVHPVHISKPFAIGKFEITRGQFAIFSKETGYKSEEGCWTIKDGKYGDNPERNWHDTGFLQQDNHPAVCISWKDATRYIEWLSNKTGKEYRLPSESEWEYAARGNTNSARYWGDSPENACRYANVMDSTGKSKVANVQWRHNCNDGFAFTAPVGSKKPNPFGLYDMLGNVWEWTQDSYHDSYTGAPGDGSAWTRDGKDRVIRGGSWLNREQHVRVAERASDEPTDHDNFTGFRVARTISH